MKRINIIRFILFLGISFIVSNCAISQENRLSELLEKIKTYDLGKGMDDLNAVQEIVIQSSTDPEAQKRVAYSLTQVLGTDATFASKQFICRQLAIIGSELDVPALAKLLRDEKLSDMARYALLHIDHPIVDQYFLEALTQTSGRTQIGIINTIGNRKNVNAVNQLRLLLNGDDVNVAMAAAQALGKIGGRPAVRSLRNAFSRSTGDLRIAVEDAFLLIANNLLSGSDNKSAIEIYENLFFYSKETYIQVAALKGLQQAGYTEAATLIFSVLKGGNFELQKAASSLIPAFTGGANALGFANLLPQLPAKVQVMVLNALRVKGDQAALSQVKDACTNPDPQVRTAALEAIGALGNASCISLLAEHAANGEPEERNAARESLALLRDTNTNNQILSLIEKGDPNIQVELINSLPQRQVQNVSGMLFGIARQDAAGPRKAALKALGALASEGDLQELIDLMLQLKGSDQKDAEITIPLITRRTDSESQCISILLKMYETASQPDQKLSIIRVLAIFKNDDALPLLRSALQDNNTEIQTEAVRSLSVWRNATPLQDLLKVAGKSPEPLNRIIALRGFINLIDKDSLLTSDEKVNLYTRAMKLAEQDVEKKQALGKLGNQQSFAALNVVMLYLDGPLKDEAGFAATRILEKVYNQNYGQAARITEKILNGSANENVRSQAKAIAAMIRNAENADMDKEFGAIEPVSLFDGKTFKGWEGGQEFFRIENGAIVAGWLDKDIPHNAFLCTEKRYYDFELRVKFKLIGQKDKANAGVQFRSERIPNHYEVGGYQADFGQEYWGNLYDESRRNKILVSVDKDTMNLAAKPDDWNEYVIRCVGNRIQLWLNGHQTADYTESDDTLDQVGIIGVQIHKGPASEAWYKDITIKELKNSVPFRLHVINADSPFEAGTNIDINNDGIQDIFSGGFWYEGPNWTKHFVREVPSGGGYYYDFSAIPIDVDNDGWMDIVNGSWHGKDVYWVRNPGKSGEQFKTIKIDEPGFLETVIGIDINGDGQTDFLPNTVGSLIWYEYKKDPGAEYGVKWIKHELQKEAAGHGVGAGDINGDGRVDIVTPKGWLEQPASPDGQWSFHKDFNLSSPSVPMLVYDIDQDGDADLIWGAGHGYGMYWMEQISKTGGQITWEKHEFDSSWSQPHFLILADINNDGQQELLTGKRYYAHNGNDPGEEHPICVYYYQFDRAAKTWTRHVLHEGGRVGFGIYTAVTDMDKDGDLDVICPGKSGLYLLENLSNLIK